MGGFPVRVRRRNGPVVNRNTALVLGLFIGAALMWLYNRQTNGG